MNLVDKTARRLAKDLDQLTVAGGRLPSLRYLSQHYGVSLMTMMKAAQMLRNRGLIQFSRGRGLRLPLKDTPETAQTAVSAPEKFYRDMMIALNNGRYKTGKPLPKTALLSKEYAISTHTINRVMRKLHSSGRIHKKGRFWFAGCREEAQINLSVRSSDIVLLLMEKEGAWRSLHTPRTHDFCRAFSAEAAYRGTEIIPVLAKSGFGTMLLAGRDAVFQKIHELDERFAGTLVIESRKDFPELDVWLNDLAHANRPVVWFDRYDEGWDQIGVPENVSRCHFDEFAAVCEAVSVLYNAGHRIVAYPLRTPEPGWINNRLELVKRCITEQYPDMSLIDQESLQKTPDFSHTTSPESIRTTLWYKQLPPCFQDLLNNFYSVGPEMEKPENPMVRFSYLAYMVLYTQPMIKALANRLTTAIIAPHDERARFIYYWLLHAKIAIPGEVSLISFDNYPELHPHPITTIDFGFDYLGFSAFHAIVQDVPNGRIRDGSIGAIPKIISRGSVGKVPEKRFPISRLFSG